MRFINADPIRFDGGMNWYAAFGNNPLSFIDPTGFCAEAPDRGPSAEEQFARAAYETIPGVVAYDNMRANWSNGHKGHAVLNGIQWVGEQALFALTLGQKPVSSDWNESAHNYCFNRRDRSESMGDGHISRDAGRHRWRAWRITGTSHSRRATPS
jgi:hypothetical protein